MDKKTYNHKKSELISYLYELANGKCGMMLFRIGFQFVYDFVAEHEGKTTADNTEAKRMMMEHKEVLEVLLLQIQETAITANNQRLEREILKGLIANCDTFLDTLGGVEK
ncbi:MAG: hypothetical protein KGV56_00120 [Gammaproteobacteria bacterium]|nr:hypothetical protein [Gammaproteobacteria bacterium]